MMKNALMGLCCALAAMVGLGRADDFPPVRNFGPFCRFAGGNIVNAPLLMGPTGLLGWIHGREFVVREVEPGSPADGVLRPGDVVMRANGHTLGADPRMGLGTAIGESEAADGKLRLSIYRDGRELDVTLQLRRLGPYSPTWPFECRKSRKLLDIFCDYLASIQGPDGAFAQRTPAAVNGLILLANPDPKHLENCRRLAYNFCRNKASMGGLGTWSTSYTGIYLAEYYMVTGDRAVLPELERVCRILAEGQQPCGSWGHGAKINRYYAVGGIVSQCGLSAWLALVLGKRAGVAADERAIERSARFFGSFADRGHVPYGDHRPWYGKTGNGKDALAAIAFDLLGEKQKARIFADYITEYYPHRELGHTGPYFAFVWGPVAALRTTRNEDLRRFLDYWRWFYDLARSWEGGGLLFVGDNYLKRGYSFCTGAIAMPYALSTGVKRLAVMGAPRGVFSPEPLPPVIAKARELHFAQQWDKMRDLLRRARLAGEDARLARQLLQAADAAGKSIELTVKAVEDNLARRWHPDLARRQLEDLKTFMVNDDPRIGKLLARLDALPNLKAIAAARKVYDKYVRLSAVDETARREMEKLADNPDLGYLAELARKELHTPADSCRYIYTLEADWHRFLGSWQNHPLALKGFIRMATTRGGNWPAQQARIRLQAAGHLLLDKETLEGWTELLPITDKQGKRGKPKSGRFLFLPREKAFEGPRGWHLPAFDDSAWRQGIFPVGTFHGNRSTTMIPRDKRAVFARVHFRLDDTRFSALRLLFRIRHLANVYLNGHLVARVLYRGNEGGYGTIYQALDLHPDAPRLLKKGDNVLALEGGYDLWWGIFDAGLYGKPGQPPPAVVSPVPPPPATTTPYPRSERDDPRFTPKDVWAEQQAATAGLSVPALVQKLDDRSFHVRLHAARALGSKGAQAVPALIGALKHPRWHVRRGACDAIAAMGKSAPDEAKAAIPALAAALDDRDFYVREGAALALAAFGSPPEPAIPRLVKLLDDPDSWWPREAAVQALGGKARGLLPALLAALNKTTNVRTETTLRRAIIRYATGPLADETVEKVVGMLREEKSWFREKILLELLRAMKKKAVGAESFLGELARRFAGDKDKRDYIQKVLKAIRG